MTRDEARCRLVDFRLADDLVEATKMVDSLVVLGVLKLDDSPSKRKKLKVPAGIGSKT